MSDTLGHTCKHLIKQKGQTKQQQQKTNKKNPGKVGAHLKNVKEMQLMFMANFGSKK